MKKKRSLFQTTIKQYAGKAPDAKTLTTLNKPWSDPKTALSAEEKAFLEDLIKKIKNNDINLLVPGSILNQSVYDALSPEAKRKTDLWIHATLASIRRINDFYYNPYDNNSDMMIDMVKDLMMKKEMLEKELGDVLKI